MPALGDRGDHALGWTADLPDRYEVVREHGRGGMATVYLATDRKHDRAVALKVLAPELAAGIGAERFLREIQIAAHVNHPHIVPLLDSGIVDGRPFYVMPFVEGESLKERLTREGDLPVEAALRIACDVGEALAHAHDRGVVHRDIKPGNILLAGTTAVVTDFGIALAMDEAAREPLTRAGLSVGTPGYMSPEQASGDEDVDSRTDQYSLAAVLFEMVTGNPPFTGRSARAILGRQLTQPVPDVTELREGVPAELGDLLQTALSRTAADRFGTTAEFAAELEALVHRSAAGTKPISFHTRPAIWLALILVSGLAAAAWLIPGLGVQRSDPAPTRTADALTYAVFPFYSELKGEVAVGEQLRLYDALTRWNGIHVIQPFQLRGRMERSGAAELTLGEAAAVALDEGAGRFIVGRLDDREGAVRAEATVYDAAANPPTELKTATVLFSRSMLDSDSAFAVLADLLLFPGDPPESARDGGKERSYPAHLAYQVGYRALEYWDLVGADSAFTLATQLEPDFARAHLWSALVRAWSGADASTWRPFAEQAVLHSAELSAGETDMAAAVAAQAQNRFGEACATWRQLTRSHDRDFTSWYGLAACLHMDPLVHPDEESPSGWSFRSSFQEAQTAYRMAFDRLPSILESLSSDSYRSLRRLLLMSGHHMRVGYPETGERARFLAYPTWKGDTLAYVPWPADVALSPEAQPSPADMAAAVEQQRRVFLEVARSWAAVAPRSARAREALALGLLLNGHASALDTLLSAQPLASTATQRRSLAVREVWMRVGLALPGNPSSLSRARRLADSLLTSAAESLEPDVAAGLAALRGRAVEAAASARAMPAESGDDLTPIAQANGRALLVFAALRGPLDSLVRLDREVAQAIEQLHPPGRRAAVRERWLAVPTTLAFPSFTSSEADDLEDWLVALQLDALEGDTARVLQRLAEARSGRGREGALPYTLTFDALLSEASLLAYVGRPREATDVVDPTLAALPLVDLEQLARPEQTASLVRLAALRAELADALGDDRAAAAWARAVLILWSDADPHLQNVMRRMDRIGP